MVLILRFELTHLNNVAHFMRQQIVPKSLLVKKYQKDKMIQEIRIHRKLKNKHIVK